MRKFKRFPPRRSRFRLPLILTGALLLLAALASTANADLIAYFNFQHAVDGGPPDFTVLAPGNPGGGVVLTTITTDYATGEVLSNAPGLSSTYLPVTTISSHVSTWNSPTPSIITSAISTLMLSRRDSYFRT